MSSTGRSYLTYLDSAQRARIIGRFRSADGAAQPVDPDEIEAILQRASQHGYAIVDNAWFDGVSQIGAAIVQDGAAIGGVGVAIPSHRLQPALVDSLGGQLKAAARVIADRLDSRRTVAAQVAPGLAP